VTDLLHRTRAALKHLLGGRPADAGGLAAPAATVPIDDLLALAGGQVTFLDVDRAAADPRVWLRLFQAAVERGLPIADSALELIRAHTSRLTADAMLWGSVERRRFVALLRPREGLAARLQQLRDCGLLAVLFPAFYREGSDAHNFAAVARLERLLGESDLTGSRFGTMLRELHSPELVVLALLVHRPASWRDHDPVKAADLALPALDLLQLDLDARHAVDFLIEKQLQMAQFAFRQDTSDPEVIARFAAALMNAAQLNSLSGEEHLKMLCVMTVGDLGSGGREPLTSWRAELLWRLFVDTYNHLTIAYGDEVIDREAAARTILHRDRPADISEAELARFLEGLPQRYLTLFDPGSIYQHVRLWRNIGPDDVHSFLSRKGEAWELAVVTLDKPFLFTNISGALASLGLDIQRGQALTSRSGLVLDVFQFIDYVRPVNQAELTELLSDVVAGKVDIAARLAKQQVAPPPGPPALPRLYFDNDSSNRYTVLELVADDVPGLLQRVSRVLSSFGCEVDLVLISTEGEKAIDVFHIRKDGGKLTESDQLALTESLERAIADSA
jgi:[protein-PII] uridylyltransferase